VVTPRLSTIGYEGLDVQDLIARLREHGIKRVVDVRELPLSRRRGFSKLRLTAALEEAGIAYEHVRALGNPKPLRDRFKAGDVLGGALDYRAHLHNGSREALLKLAASIGTEHTCLLCVEKEHGSCHRSIIAGALAEHLPRVAVVHL
jgi:uncharacterized protein (DUF488 family)